jgi:hypothetical protein
MTDELPFVSDRFQVGRWRGSTCLPEKSLLPWKPQRSLDPLEARLVAQRIGEGVNFRVRDSKPGIKIAADSGR